MHIALHATILHGARRGSIGLMGVLADAALAQGVHVIGVAPRRLLEREVVHARLTELTRAPRHAGRR